MSASCASCGKTAYPNEQIKALNATWHKSCFKCETCKTTLSLNSVHFNENIPYCQIHVPVVKNELEKLIQTKIDGDINLQIMMKRLTYLENYCQSLKSKVDSLELENKQLNVQKKMSEMDNRCQSLKSKVDSLEMENKQFSLQLQKLQIELATIKNQNQHHSNHLGLMTRQTLSVSESVKFISELKFKETKASFNEIMKIIELEFPSLKISLMLKDLEKWYKGWLFEPNPFNLSADEVKSLCLYTHDLYGEKEDNFYFQLNEVLRKRKMKDLSLFEGYLFYIFSGLKKLPNVSTTIYRGIPNFLKSKIETDYVQSRPIHWSGFSSGTEDLNTAKEFAGADGVIFEIRIFSGKSIENFSFLPNEKEILLSPNLEFKVKESLKKREDGYYYVQLQEESVLIY